MTTEGDRVRYCKCCGDPVADYQFVRVDGWREYRCVDCNNEIKHGFVPKLEPSRCGRAQPTLDETGPWRDIAVRALEDNQ